jgi:hypothetical protein
VKAKKRMSRSDDMSEKFTLCSGMRDTDRMPGMGGFSQFFVGTSVGLLAVLHAFSTLNFRWLLAGLAAGYAFAWKDMLSGRIRF